MSRLMAAIRLHAFHARQVISAASDACEHARNTQITPWHLAIALAEDSTGMLRRLAEKMGYEVDKFAHAVRGKIAALPKQVSRHRRLHPTHFVRAAGTPPTSPQDPAPTSVAPDSHLLKLLKAADGFRKSNSDSHVSVDHLIQATFADTGLAKVYVDVGWATDKMAEELRKLRGSKKVTSEHAESSFDALSKYGVDLCARAEAGKLDPVIGRDDEVRRVRDRRVCGTAPLPPLPPQSLTLSLRGGTQVIRILARRTKNNPVLVGPPGVGK